MNSPVVIPASHTVMTKNKNKNKGKNQKNKKNNKQAQVIVREIVRAPKMSIGAQLGDSLQKFGTSLFKRLIGQGDYVVSPNIKDVEHNALMNKFNDQGPRFYNSGNSFVFEHAEYFGDVLGTTSFDTSSFDINPSNSALFPWLSSMSRSFESYSIEGMIIRYNSTSGQATGTNTGLGTVGAYVAYDVNDPLPQSKAVLLQYDGAVDCKPSENFLMGVECDPSRLVMKRLYVGQPTSQADARFHDFGKLVVFTQGNPNTTTPLGELWVHYRVRFFFPKISNPTVGIVPLRTAFVSGSPTDTDPFKNLTVVYDGGIEMVRKFDNRVGFIGVPGSVYMVRVRWTAAGGSASPSRTRQFYNCALITTPSYLYYETLDATLSLLTDTYFVQVTPSELGEQEVSIAYLSTVLPTESPVLEGSITQIA